MIIWQWVLVIKGIYLIYFCNFELLDLHFVLQFCSIEKMYRQILVEDDQCDYQRIIWRFAPDEPFRSYRLKTLTYGTSPAPYLAIRTLKQLALDMAEEYPIAARIILYHMYMDDAAAGAFSSDLLIEIYRELKKVFSSAGMNLRK